MVYSSQAKCRTPQRNRSNSTMRQPSVPTLSRQKCCGSRFASVTSTQYLKAVLSGQGPKSKTCTTVAIATSERRVDRGRKLRSDRQTRPNNAYPGHEDRRFPVQICASGCKQAWPNLPRFCAFSNSFYRAANCLKALKLRQCRRGRVRTWRSTPCTSHAQRKLQESKPR